MDQCFRTALWMFVLIGYLQAKRGCSGQDDLRLCSLKRDVKCENVKFASPTNVKVNCFYAAVQSFMGGLVHARTSCVDERGHINSTLETLERYLSTLTNSTDCALVTKESQFEGFLQELKTFNQHYKTNSRTSAN